MRQVELWRKFSAQVENHIEQYVVPQYGDEGDDLATAYDVNDCVRQAEKYLKRFGRSARPGEEVRDLIKAAHYIQKAVAKLEASGASK